MDPSFWRDPAWQAVGVVIAFASLALTIHLLGRGRKSLGFQVLSHQPIVKASVAEAYRSRVTVLFDGEPLTAVSQAVIRIGNIGNVPVVPGDYHSPLLITFQQGTEVLEALAATDSKSLQCSVSSDGNEVRVAPLLLNTGDRVTIRVLRRGEPSAVLVTARIAGVSVIEDVGAPMTRGALAAGMLLAVALFAFLMGVQWLIDKLLKWAIPPDYAQRPAGPIGTAALFGAVLVFLWIVLWGLKGTGSNIMKELRHRKLRQ